MNIKEWKDCVRMVLTDYELRPTDDEMWEEVTAALLCTSETEGLPLLDAAVTCHRAGRKRVGEVQEVMGDQVTMAIEDELEIQLIPAPVGSNDPDALGPSALGGFPTAPDVLTPDAITEWTRIWKRCACCGGKLHANWKDGCARGNCALRPLPIHRFDAERYARESAEMLGGGPK